MNNLPPPQNHVPLLYLSFDEIVYLCTLLNRPPFLGLGVDLYESITPEQRAYGLICAERSLRARGVARLDETGSIQVQNDLLNAIGTAAYAQQTYILQQVSTDAVLNRISTYVLEDQITLLFSPASMIIGIVVLPSREQMIAEMVAFCLPAGPTIASEGQHQFVVSGELLESIRQAAATDSATIAAQLGAEKVPPASAKSFATTVSTPHSVAMVHVVTPQTEDRTAVQQFSVIQNEDSAWLAVETPDTTENGKVSYAVSTLSGERLGRLFAEWLLPK